ncbi:MAG: hypothetical protein ABI423_09065 [Burkholderiales bacterium]
MSSKPKPKPEPFHLKSTEDFRALTSAQKGEYIGQLAAGSLQINMRRYRRAEEAEQERRALAQRTPY